MKEEEEEVEERAVVRDETSNQTLFVVAIKRRL